MILSQLSHFFFFSFLIKISVPKGNQLCRNLKFHFKKMFPDLRNAKKKFEKEKKI